MPETDDRRGKKRGTFRRKKRSDGSDDFEDIGTRQCAVSGKSGIPQTPPETGTDNDLGSERDAAMNEIGANVVYARIR